ncbi:MAG TPA: alpha-amylase family glycosyl hydrolase [Polyangiaceae bacterium]|jgi:glycosidase
MTSKHLRALAVPLGGACIAVAALLACGNDQVHQVNYGQPPDAAAFDAGNGGSSPYGGDGGTGTTTTIPEAGPPQCSDDLKLCAETFTLAYGGEQSVELRGDYRAGAWTQGDPMTHTGSAWTVTVNVPWNQPVQYKFFLNGTTWEADPANPAPPNDPNDADGNSIEQPITCPDTYTCSSPPVPPAGVFDWRDAVIYFAFVDRFLDGDPTNDCNVSGTESTPYTSTNYLGGDWAGVTQKIIAGYFTDLGVNTIWLTVPIKNADDVADQGVNGDTHMYSGYHGYWPKDPTQTESCFGSASDLQALVQAAHAKNIKVLFDYAMVHVHTESSIYTQHQNDSPPWFTPNCVCGAPGCGNFDTSCWFAPYLAHYDYTNSAARTFSINAAISLIQQNGNDAFRLDAIKQVDPSWLANLRPAISSQILASETPQQRFYMVGETYDFQNRALIASMIDSSTKLDGQFDFPLRIRLVEALLMRSTQNMLTPDDLNWGRTAPPGMQGLAEFMDSNDSFYPSDAVMSTFIGNHDLPRSIHYAEQTLPAWLQASSPSNPSAADGKNAAWSGEPQTETDPNTYQRLANAFAVILTNKGAPLIYYGDEIGLPGAGDPDNRRMMTWSGTSPAQQGLYARIKALTAIRAAHPAMRRGTRATLFVNEDLWVYELTTQAGDPSPDTVYVAINRSDADMQTTALPGGLTELITNTPATSPMTIPARETRVFK